MNVLSPFDIPTFLNFLSPFHSISLPFSLPIFQSFSPLNVLTFLSFLLPIFYPFSYHFSFPQTLSFLHLFRVEKGRRFFSHSTFSFLFLLFRFIAHTFSLFSPVLPTILRSFVSLFCFIHLLVLLLYIYFFP